MESKNISYNSRLDEIRGIACFLVFIFHSLLGGRKIPPLGVISVGLFCILTGYLFTSIFLHKDSVHYGRYILNRVLRIFPVLTLLFLFYMTLYPASIDARGLLLFFTMQLNLLNDYQGALLPGLDIVTHTWTLALEFQFYLIFPILFATSRKSPVRTFFYLIVGILLLRWAAFIMVGKVLSVHYSFLTRFNSFIFGMILAYLNYHFSFRQRKMYSLYLIVLAPLTLYVSLTWWPLWWKYLTYDVIFMMLTLCVFLYLYRERKFEFFYKPIQKLGVISYSFYIWHLLCIKVIFRLFSHHHYTATLLSFVLTITISVITYNLIEKPFMSLRKKY